MKLLFSLLVAILLCADASLNLANAQNNLPDAIRLRDYERFEAAEKIFLSLLREQPLNGNIYYHLGENYFLADQKDSAMALFDRGIQIAPNSPLNYAGKGKCMLFDGKVVEAKSLFDKSTTVAGPKEYLHLLEIAEAYMEAPAKNAPEAMALLEQAGKLAPEDPKSLMLKGDCYLLMADGNKAIELYKKAKEKNGNKPLILVREGLLYSRSKNYTLAVEKYLEAIQTDSTFAPAYVELGEVYYRSKQFEKANQQYRTYLRLSGNQTQAKIKYAKSLFRSENYTETIQEIDEIQKVDSSSNNLNRLLAYSLFEAGNYTRCLSSINNYLRRAPADKSTVIGKDYAYRAKALSKLGKDSLAISDFILAIETDTSDSEVLSDLADTYFKLKNYSGCIGALKQKENTSKLGNNDLYKLGRAYYFQKEFSSADTTFGRLIALAPSFDQGYFWRARANAQLDPESKTGQALPYYQTYTTKVADPAKAAKNLVEAYSYIGAYYFQTKEKELSKAAWLKVMEIEPENKKAKAALDAIK